MALYFVICETGNKKIIKRVYHTSEECRDYFDSLVRDIQARPENYRVISRADTELSIEEVGEQGAGSQRKYTCLTGEISDVADLVQESKHDDTNSL
jgi:hypothetical protein